MNKQLAFDGMPPPGLRPFWRYYGGKWRAAPLYPQPHHGTIIEPFAGAAGYSLRYAHLRVVLVEKYPPVAEVWRWLIGASASDVLAIPQVIHVDELPDSVRDGARELVRFCLSVAQTRPCNQLSAGFVRQSLEHPTWTRGWDARQRDLVASQVPRIKHWRLIEGDYTGAPLEHATWFIDPPYNNAAGAKYPCGPKHIDFAALGQWCRARPGQVIVCEQLGADWLPFRSFGRFRRGLNNIEGSAEAIWLSEWERAA